MQRTSGSVRIVIAGGGTGGHVTPAIAVHDELKHRDIETEFLWIGSASGIEGKEAARAGIPFTAIQTGKFRRYFDLKTVTDAGRLPIGFVQAANRLRRFRPDVVFSTGGFVSVPTVVASRFFAPVVTHEQTAIVGLANKINAKFAKVLAVSYDSTAAAANGLGSKMIVTGNPVRAALRTGRAERAREHFGFTSELPVVYVTGGARGASAINQRITAILPDLLEHAQVVHQTGDRAANPDYELAVSARAGLPEHLQRRYAPREFIGPEISDLFAAASLVIGRAGAGTIAEIAYLGLPAILIPLPGSGGGEQDRNADLLARCGGAIVLPQTDATAERLKAEVFALLSDQARLAGMAAATRSISREDAATRLADLLLQHCRR
jgi:UDP-N-acetylglucosamine--N-acetylmuramyl-(pentapeptide) pyrophosphoryl-undecaprenol N-acetylglucosamine transferase